MKLVNQQIIDTTLRLKTMPFSIGLNVILLPLSMLHPHSMQPTISPNRWLEFFSTDTMLFSQIDDVHFTSYSQEASQNAVDNTNRIFGAL
mmetsp:Transcript_39583/g.55776  ORF Transcript_39583/g.55776 Transcript_39583/m.55776 type:complete len:90 (+) Transcript_39583:722-991(+)